MCIDILTISAWHGTTQKYASKIKTGGFKNNTVDFTGRNFRNPNDLGAGVYFYIDSDYGKGYKLANDYACKYKDKICEKQHCGIEVIETEISVQSDRLLDLDENETNLFFIEFANKHERERQKIIDKLKNDGARRRGNYDGIMVELFIHHINEQIPNKKVQVVQKKTYTLFDRFLSNFHNGLELCVRDTDCINIKDRGKDRDGNGFKKFL